MKIALKTMMVLFVICIVAFGVILILNRGDEPLSPQTLQKLNSAPVHVPAEAVLGFKYILGINVAADQDPRKRGEEIYTHIQNLSRNLESTSNGSFRRDNRSLNPQLKLKWEHPYLKNEKYGEYEGQIENTLTENKISLERLDELLKIGSYGSDQPPTGFKFPIQFPFAIYKIKFVQLSALMHKGQRELTLQQLKAMHHFFTASLQYPQPLIESMIALVISGNIRSFIEDAAQDNFEFKKLLSPEILKEFHTALSFENIRELSLKFEVLTVAEVFKQPLDIRGLGIAGFDDESNSNGTAVGSLGNRMASLFFRPNQSLNEYVNFVSRVSTDTCAKGNGTCDSTPISQMTFINPIGNILARMLSTNLEGGFKKMYDRILKLNQPLNII